MLPPPFSIFLEYPLIEYPFQAEHNTEEYEYTFHLALNYNRTLRVTVAPLAARKVDPLVGRLIFRIITIRCVDAYAFCRVEIS